MKPLIGYQISSIRAYLDTEEHFHDSVVKLAAMGYTRIQLQWASPDLSNDFIAKELKDNGIECVGTQDPYLEGFGPYLQNTLDRTLATGSRYMVFSKIPPEWNNPADLKALAKEMTEVNRIARSYGLILGFHPNDYNYKDRIDGVPTYEYLLNLLPDDVQLNYCIHASFRSGVEYEEVLRKFAGRVDLVHFKDSKILPDGTRHLMPLSEGEHDWVPIAQACQQAGVKYIFTEQEKWLKDPFESAKIALDYTVDCLNRIEEKPLW
ncbi:MAG: sugar phosphate isomerase/epimerase [Firmicutes bacterium]|nr:sugar phosphate isomerase/epimerase [Bacillota bacterium]